MNLKLLIVLILFYSCSRVFCQQTDDFRKLQNLIELQIKKDNINQKNIINLVLPVQIKEDDFKTINKSTSLQKMNELNQAQTKSTSFFHMGGFYLRIYLFASNEFSNDAKLELIRDNSSANKPDELVRTLTDSSFDTKVSYFDYHITKRVEYFHLTVQLSSKKPGRALALITMIPNKEYKFDK